MGEFEPTDTLVRLPCNRSGSGSSAHSTRLEGEMPARARGLPLSPASASRTAASAFASAASASPDVATWVERFGPRGTEQNELLRSEFGENSCKIQEHLNNSENFNIF